MQMPDVRRLPACENVDGVDNLRGVAGGRLHFSAKKAEPGVDLHCLPCRKVRLPQRQPLLQHQCRQERQPNHVQFR